MRSLKVGIDVLDLKLKLLHLSLQTHLSSGIPGTVGIVNLSFEVLSTLFCRAEGVVESANFIVGALERSFSLIG